MGKGKTGRKGDEGMSNGGRGGGGGVGRRENWEKMSSPLNRYEVHTFNFWSFVDTFCNFVRTN